MSNACLNQRIALEIQNRSVTVGCPHNHDAVPEHAPVYDISQISREFARASVAVNDLNVIDCDDGDEPVGSKAESEEVNGFRLYFSNDLSGREVDGQQFSPIDSDNELSGRIVEEINGLPGWPGRIDSEEFFQGRPIENEGLYVPSSTCFIPAESGGNK